MDRKEAKRQFKQQLAPMGVFQVRNLADGRVFVSAAANLPGQMNSLRFQLQNGLHLNRALQEDFTRLGAAGFAFEELERLEPAGNPGVDCGPDLRALEAKWLDKLQPYDERGYNRRRPAVARTD